MRAVIGAIVGAVVLFIWGAVFWMGLSWSFDGLRSLEPEQEQAVVEALNTNIAETGAYYLPGMPTHGKDLPDDEARRLNDEWQARHEAGPLGLIVYIKDGRQPMEPTTFLSGFAINLLSTVLVTLMLVISGGSRVNFARRFFAIALFGLACSVAVHLIDWNWMFTPTRFTMMKVTDTTLGWVIAGLFMAMIIRAPKPKAE